MKHGTTLFLKSAVILIGIPVLAMSILGLPWLANNPVNPDYAHMLYPVLIGMYVTAMIFYFALYQTFKLLGYIDMNKAFSERSVQALKTIKYCAGTISALYLLMLPFVYLIAEKDDSPGLILVGAAPVFAALVVSVFAAVLERLLKEALDIKSENDLTV
ncbi:MAG: DUF2975 domain-containing protein [Eubacteriaceae bacterium]|nr:DUF2975 domain-containing protein [Eubacteriaceae bacterium]